MSVSKNKWRKLQALMTELNIKPDDLIEQFIAGSGPGGQKVNKTSSCVILKHIPSGLIIKCQIARSQGLNRYYARESLVQKLLDAKHEKEQNSLRNLAKERQRNRLPSRTEKAKMVQEKRRRAHIKKLRKVSDD